MLLKFVVGIVLSSASSCWGAEWQTKNGEIAHAVGIVTSDGTPASLEVRCQPDPEVTLTHPVLASMPANKKTGRLDWYQGALIHAGFGLDLTRPDHGGHLGLWDRCAHRRYCVHTASSQTASYIRLLRKNRSLFIRITPPDADIVDLRVSLVGSAKAIDSVCSSSDTDGQDQFSPQGTFHGVSKDYLQKYLDEFAFRFNRRRWEGQLPFRLLEAAIHAPLSD